MRLRGRSNSSSSPNLYRSSKNARSWRLRYFILNKSYLYYYRSDAEVRMSGVVMC